MLSQVKTVFKPQNNSDVLETVWKQNSLASSSCVVACDRIFFCSPGEMFKECIFFWYPMFLNVTNDF